MEKKVSDLTSEELLQILGDCCPIMRYALCGNWKIKISYKNLKFCLKLDGKYAIM